MDHNNNLFADNQQFNSYDNLNLFQNGSDSNFNEAGWGVNASDFGSQSRAQVPAGWQQNANHHLSVPSSHAGYNGQASPYGRAINQSPLSFNQNQYQNFDQQQQQSFQPYGQSQYDQALFPRPANGQSFNTTITPQALERDAQAGYTSSPYGNPAFANNAFGQNPMPRPGSTTIQGRPVNQKLLSDAAPKGIATGMFSIIDFDTLARATNTERMGNYVNIGKEPLELGLTRSAIPLYAPRKSRSELRALASNNPAALARIGKKSSKKTKSYPSLLSDIKSASASASAGIKYEQDSSSSEESSSSSSSEYTDDDDDEDSPLPAKRPENPKAGVEYDTIKALWRSKRKTLSSESIRKGLVDFWDLVKNIRDRWKKDAQDVADAEEKKQTGQLPLLQSRVKDQRDMIESAFKAALKHGHRGLLEL